MDFMHDTLADGSRMRVLTVIDVHTRECLALEARRSFRGSDVALILSDLGGAAGEEIIIIVNKEISLNHLDLNTVIDIYTNQKTKWGSGEKIHLSMLRKGPVHDQFSNQIIGIAPQKLVRIWKKVIFTGLGTPPKVVDTEAELIKYVAATKGAIGYIRASTPFENVKALELK